jgi:hypothetical protein
MSPRAVVYASSDNYVFRQRALHPGLHIADLARSAISARDPP